MLLFSMTAGDTEPLRMRAINPVTRDPEPLINLNSIKFFLSTQKGVALITAAACDLTYGNDGIFEYPWLIGETELVPGTYLAHFDFRKDRETALWADSANDPQGDSHAEGDELSAAVANDHGSALIALTGIVQPPLGAPSKVKFEAGVSGVSYSITGLDEWGVTVTETGTGTVYETSHYFQRITTAKFNPNGDAGTWDAQLLLGSAKVTSAQHSRKPASGYLLVQVQVRP